MLSQISILDSDSVDNDQRISSFCDDDLLPLKIRPQSFLEVKERLEAKYDKASPWSYDHNIKNQEEEAYFMLEMAKRTLDEFMRYNLDDERSLQPEYLAITKIIGPFMSENDKHVLNHFYTKQKRVSCDENNPKRYQATKWP